MEMHKRTTKATFLLPYFRPDPTCRSGYRCISSDFRGRAGLAGFMSPSRRRPPEKNKGAAVALNGAAPIPSAIGPWPSHCGPSPHAPLHLPASEIPAPALVRLATRAVPPTTGGCAPDPMPLQEGTPTALSPQRTPAECAQSPGPGATTYTYTHTPSASYRSPVSP